MTAPCVRRYDQGIDLLQALARVRVVPVLEIGEARRAVPLAVALSDGGLTCVEITFRTAAAVEAMAGAQFLVAPGLSPALAAWASAHGIPLLPGVCTPTEIEQAADLGLRLLKFFPAEAAGGVAYLKALGGPFRDVRFVPTGGISPGNLAAYLELPAVVACGGSWMAPPPLVAAADFAAVTRLASEAVEIAGIHRQERS